MTKNTMREGGDAEQSDNRQGQGKLPNGGAVHHADTHAAAY